MKINKKGNQCQCEICVLDDSVSDIIYDINGVCNYCKFHQKMRNYYPNGPKGRREIIKLVSKIKKSKKKEYDCIVGVSGGVDSTYTLYMAKKLGLRPLAVHIDNGWNSELSVRNIELITKSLDVDLHTIVLDWNSFRDLQVSFLKASVPDGEIPSDIALQAGLFDIAIKEKVKYIIFGYNFRDQGISPITWTYMDGKYINSVHNDFSSSKLLNYPNLTIEKLVYSTVFKGIRAVSLLEYIDYDTKKVKKFLIRKLGWKPYGGKHFESTYTKFFQGVILPQKFNIDKRKIYLSTQIRENRLSRKEAINLLEKVPPYPKNNIDLDQNYVLKKLNLSPSEFDKIMKLPIKSFKDYDTYLDVIHLLRYPVKIACDLNILPVKFYEKYVKGMI